jgi:glycosyltransferase involved in cell wall biosynthesis
MLYSKEFEPNPVLYRQCQTLLKNGYNVKIIAWDRTAKHPKIENIDGISVHNIGVKCSYGNPFDLSAKIPLYYFHLFRIVVKEKIDLLHCHDIQTIPIGLFIGKLLGKKVIYDVHDFYFPDSPWIKKIFKDIDAWMASNCDYVLVSTPRFLDYYKNINPNTRLIYNVPDNIFVPKEKPEKTTSTFIISYLGVVRRVKDLFDLMEATSGVHDIKIFIGGYGTKMDEVKEIAKRYDHVHIGGKVAYRSIVKRYWMSDCIYAVYPNTKNIIEYSIPMKIFEAMACGIPVIVNTEGFHGEFVREHKVGLGVEYGDLQQIKNAIIKLRDDDELKKKLGENGRKLVEGFYNWEKMQERLLEVYTNLEGKKSIS